MRALSVLLVCLGNICRSPLAEAAFRAEAARAGFPLTVDSAGTGDWHAGSPPDPRSVSVAKNAGIDITTLRARKVKADDFRRFTHIFAMDARNLAELKAIRPADATAHLSLLLDVVPGRTGADVSDPYYDGEDQFEITWDDVTSAARTFIKQQQQAR